MWGGGIQLEFGHNARFYFLPKGNKVFGRGIAFITKGTDFTYLEWFVKCSIAQFFPWNLCGFFGMRFHCWRLLKVPSSMLCLFRGAHKSLPDQRYGRRAFALAGVMDMIWNLFSYAEVWSWITSYNVGRHTERVQSSVKHIVFLLYLLSLSECSTLKLYAQKR